MYAHAVCTRLFSLPPERAGVRGYRDSSAGWAESHIKATQHKTKHLSLNIRRTQTLCMYHVQMESKDKEKHNTGVQ